MSPKDFLLPLPPLHLPYTSPHYPVCPLPEFHGQGDCGAYGEFLIETDHHIGSILKFLKTSGLDDNTMIVFTSDNGPEKVWKDRIKKYKHYSRGPYRGGKRGIYEGGHRVPFFVCWPAGIMSPGRAWDRPVGQVDLLATFAELTKATLPDTAEEDSQSFASVLLDPVSNASRLPLINHSSNGRFSVTDGDWKLIMAHGQKKLELCDLGLDEGEKTNLIDTHPIKVKKLTDQITNIVTNGRTTPGNSQSNDTGYWKDLTWIAEEEYRSVE